MAATCATIAKVIMWVIIAGAAFLTMAFTGMPRHLAESVAMQLAPFALIVQNMMY